MLFSAPEANWHRTHSLHTIKLSYPPEEDDHVQVPILVDLALF